MENQSWLRAATRALRLRLADGTSGLLVGILAALLAVVSSDVLRGGDRSRQRGGGASRGIDTLRVTGPPRAMRVRFVHSVWNMSPDRLQRVTIGVAVPQSDARQTVHSVDFDPPPASWATDSWAGQTAEFAIGDLGPNERFEVRVTIQVSLRDIEWWVLDRDLGRFEDIPAHVVRRYLGNGKKYRLESESLMRAAETLRLDRGGIIEQVRRIHDYVTDELEYERDHRWDPADAVLTRGRGSCSEYAYLMIALCRLNGIPARYAGGTRLAEAETAMPHVDRVFHRWVEVYLPRIGWYPIDPTENDRRGKEGDFYRFFGRLPWSYLTMARGGGDPLDAGLLGWDYRSGTRWSRPRELSAGKVFIDRYAVWSEEPAAVGAAETASAESKQLLTARARRLFRG